MIPRSYIKHLADLALGVNILTTLPKLQRIPFSSSCKFRQSRQQSNLLTRRCLSTTTNQCGKKSSSSKRWLARSAADVASREALLKGYKSRAALKLLEINEQHKILKPGMTVVDLGFAPGSWSQVAVSMTSPGGRVLGVDLLPAQPPKGVSSIQGDFLSPGIQASIRRYLSDPNRGRPRPTQSLERAPEPEYVTSNDPVETKEVKIDTNPVLQLNDSESAGYIAQERRETLHDLQESKEIKQQTSKSGPDPIATAKETAGKKERNTVDVVLSDMCEPWPLVHGFHMNTFLIPYARLMNTSGVNVKDHSGSMELCRAALTFCIDVLKPGGSFVCKFYAGPDDKMLGDQIGMVFQKVVRVKPEASRTASKEAYFVATSKKDGVDRSVLDPPREDDLQQA